MGELKATPGPWRQATGVGYCAIRSDAGVIADMRFVDRQYNPFDANLIAASPELYVALCSALEFTEMNTFGGNDALELMERCRTALAKARGEQS